MRGFQTVTQQLDLGYLGVSINNINSRDITKKLVVVGDIYDAYRGSPCRALIVTRSSAIRLIRLYNHHIKSSRYEIEMFDDVFTPEFEQKSTNFSNLFIRLKKTIY